MATTSLIRPEKVRVNRAAFRQNQSAMLKRAKGRRVLLVTSPKEADQKYVLDKRYFEELVGSLKGAMETLEIVTDQRLFQQMLAAAETLDRDLRHGKLHSFEQAFQES